MPKATTTTQQSRTKTVNGVQRPTMTLATTTTATFAIDVAHRVIREKERE